MTDKSKTTVRDFEIFKREFVKYQRLLGLTGVQVYFDHKPLDGENARLIMDYSECTATACLSSELSEGQTPYKDIRGWGKHEAVHLLLMRLQGEAEYRHATKESIYEAIEETVHRLENVIP